MHYEIAISHYDLSDMLSHLACDTTRVDVSLTDWTVLESCLIISCHEDTLIIMARSGDSQMQVPVSQVKAIEFEGFYDYRGVSSKIFTVE